jgi:hypothetical protein
MPEPISTAVLGSNFTIQSINGINYACIAIGDIEAVIQATLPSNPSAEQIFTGIIELAAVELTVEKRDGEDFNGTGAVANRNIAITEPDLPTIVERSGNAVLRRSRSIQADSPFSAGRKFTPDQY